MKKESDILYERGDFWVCKNTRGDFEVYQHGATHSTRVAVVGHSFPNAFERAKSEADKRATK